MSEAQQVAARDPFYDVVPERVWISVTNCKTPGRFQVVLEVNGQEKIIFDQIDETDGLTNDSTNLTWLLKDSNKATERIAKLESALITINSIVDDLQVNEIIQSTLGKESHGTKAK